MASSEAAARRRKRSGAWYTPPELVAEVVDAALAGWRLPDRAIRIVDPACGDGRFLVAAAEALAHRGASVEVTGLDTDPAAVEATDRALAAGPAPRRVELHHADALRHDWRRQYFDLVVGNPPYLSQLAAATTRRAPGPWGGGVYADAAVEFAALALELARPDGARLGLVLPQSVLSSRDAAPVRDEFDRRTTRRWSWWSASHVFDASVHVCALVFETTACHDARRRADRWTDVVTSALGIPALPAILSETTLGSVARLSANFRDEYYGMVPAVVDHGDGPPLVTSGLIDPGRLLWGTRPARFARHTFTEPRVELDRLSSGMREWARRKLVPKVLVASQTRVLEAVADVDGRLLPGVPVTVATPLPLAATGRGGVARVVQEIAAVLTSPVASIWAWHRCAGTGLSATSLRTGPKVLAALPWPAGALDAAVDALWEGDIAGCGAAVDAAFGVDGDIDGELIEWWLDAMPSQAVTPAR